jgi:hypothetical protein
VARGRPWTPTAYAPTIIKRASAASNARNRSRKSGVTGAIGMGERVHLQAQLPNELSAIIQRDAIPIQSVGIGFRFPFAGAEQRTSACARAAFRSSASVATAREDSMRG